MTGRPGLELRRLDIVRLPGIPDGFGVEAAGGVNLVVGPNESGKSSLVRAVFHLLWPEDPVRPPLDVTAVFAAADGPLHAARLDNGPVAWTRDGAPVAAPDVPGGHLARCYHLGLLDLNRPGDSGADRDLAREVRRQMAGGFDLAAVRELFPDLARTVATRRRLWQDAQRAAEVEANAQRRLAREVQGLPELEARLTACRRAGRELERLVAALRWRELRDIEVDLQAALDALPPGTDRVREGDDETLANLDARRRQKAAAAVRLRGEIADRAQRLADLAVDGDVNLARRRVQAAVAARAGADAADRERARAEAAVDAARADLAPELLAAEIPAGAAEVYTRLLGLHRDLLRLEVRGDHLSDLLAAGPLREPDPPAAAPDASPGVAALGDATRTPGPLPLVGGLLALAAGVVVAVATATSPDGPAPLLLAAAVGAGLGGALTVGAWIRTRRAATAFRRRLEAAGDACGRPLPAGWDLNRAAAHVAALAAERGEATAAAATRAALRDELTRQATSVRDERRRAVARRAELLAEWGGDVDPERPDLLHDLDRIARCRSAEEVARQARAAADHETEQLAAALAAAQAALRELGEEAAADPAALNAAVDRLERRQDKHGDLTEQQAGSRRTLAELEGDLAAAESEREALLARIALPAAATAAADRSPDPEAMLREEVALRGAARPEWERLSAEQARVRLEMSRLRRECETTGEDGAVSGATGTNPAAVDLAAADLFAADVADLHTRREEAARDAARVEDLNREIIAIRTRAEDARRGQSWEAARGLADQRIAELEDAEADDRAHTLGRLLLAEIEAEHETVARPPLLEAADAHLRTFTGHRYRLALSGSGPDADFVALDEGGRPHSLTELSDGTRAQLLLAARLAFLESAEAGLAAPLFLDEALTARDPARFDAIARALATLARDTGRQVFYLTSNPADRAAFERALARAGLPPARMIDLAAARATAAAASAAELELPPLPLSPAPASDTPEAYAARLGVTPVRPWRPAGALDVFHLWRDDLDFVHALARDSVRTVGAWENAGAALVRAGLVPAERRDVMDARIAVWKAFRDAWRVGRGRPLTRTELAAGGVLSEKMLGPAQEVLAAVDGDAAAFLQRLQDGAVKRLRQETKNALQVYLEREGHVDERSVLDESELVARALAAVAPSLRAGTLSVDEVGVLVRSLAAAAG